MLKVLLNTIVGIGLFIGGFGLAYYYLANIDNGDSGLLLIPAFGMVIASVFMFMRAGKSDETVILNKQTAETQNSAPKQGDLLKKNSQITQEWMKSVEKRDKMRMLEIASNAENE